MGGKDPDMFGSTLSKSMGCHLRVDEPGPRLLFDFEGNVQRLQLNELVQLAEMIDVAHFIGEFRAKDEHGFRGHTRDSST